MKRKPKKRIIVSDMYDTMFSDVMMEGLREFYPDASEALLDELATELYFDNRRHLMQTFADTIFPTDVICIAAGCKPEGYSSSHRAFRIYEKPTLDELFQIDRDIDEAEWYVDEYNDFRCRGYHHDGTNRYLYRQIRAEIGPKARRNFYDKIQSHTLTRKDLNHYTIALGPIVKTAEQRHYGG